MLPLPDPRAKHSDAGRHLGAVAHYLKLSLSWLGPYVVTVMFKRLSKGLLEESVTPLRDCYRPVVVAEALALRRIHKAATG